MADIDYLWIGGSGTGLDNFDFNYPGNWQKITIDPGPPNPWEYIVLQSTTDVPGPGDNVFVGIPRYEIFEEYWFQSGGMMWKDYRSYNPKRYIYTTKAPLLFGGFTGNENGGTWLNKFGSGPSGTTWNTALKCFEFGNNNIPGESGRLGEAVHKLPSNGYGFPVLGGGLTASVVRQLSYWYPYLENSIENATERQKQGLVLKANSIRINRMPLTQLHWAQQANGQTLSGVTCHNIELSVVKNFGYYDNPPNQSTTQADLNKYFRNVITTVTGRIWEASIKFKNSYLNAVNIISSGYYHPYNSFDTRTNNSEISLNNVEFSKCVLWGAKISGDAYHTIKVSPDTIFYNIESSATLTGRSNFYTPAIGNSKFEGSGNGITAYKEIFTGSLTGPTSSASFLVINYKDHQSYCPNVILGSGLSGPTVTITGNIMDATVADTNPSRWNVILEPGVYLPRLNLNKCYAVGQRTNNSLYKNVNIGQVNVNAGAALDLYTIDRDIWKIGTINGNTLIGGINIDGGVVFCSPNTRLLNYGVVNGINKRTGGVQPINNLNMQQAINEVN